MARSQRSRALETRKTRLALSQGEREWLTIGKGLAIAYRRTGSEYGTWQGRVWDGHRYHYRNLGRADDYQDANGKEILDFYQVQGKAREYFEEVTKGQKPAIVAGTVADAAKHYLEWFREHRKSVKETENAINAHILPALAGVDLTNITSQSLKSWLERLAAKPARKRRSKLTSKPAYREAPKTDDEKRARRATANRIFNVLKAILNKAFQDGMVADDSPWRKVKPFEKVDEARIRFLTDAEATRLVNACPADLRALVRAALLTGARFGELTAMKVQDVILRDSRVYVAQSKSGRPRYVPLNPEGVALFEQVTAGKTGDALVFTKANGEAWGKNHHVKPLAAACAVAKVKPDVAFHELRHTYASHLAQAGVDLLTISKLLGHADTRITAKHYAHLADKTLAAAVTKLPSFEATKTGLSAIDGGKRRKTAARR